MVPQWVPPGRQRELLTAVVKTFTVGRWKNINGGFLILTLNLIKKKRQGAETGASLTRLWLELEPRIEPHRG